MHCHCVRPKLRKSGRPAAARTVQDVPYAAQHVWQHFQGVLSLLQVPDVNVHVCGRARRSSCLAAEEEVARLSRHVEGLETVMATVTQERDELSTTCAAQVNLCYTVFENSEVYILC